MKLKNILWAIIEAAIWYIFVCYFLFVIKSPVVNIYKSALVLLVLMYAGTMACPWVRNTAAWRKMFEK